MGFPQMLTARISVPHLQSVGFHRQPRHGSLPNVYNKSDLTQSVGHLLPVGSSRRTVQVYNNSDLTQSVGLYTVWMRRKLLLSLQQFRFNPIGREFVSQAIPRNGFGSRIDAPDCFHYRSF